MGIDRFKGVLLSVLLVTSLIIPLVSFSLSSDLISASPSPIFPESFTIVVLPDTQDYSWRYPDIFENQTNWIVQNKDEKNIVFVTHLGDICEYGDNRLSPDNCSEWANADTAMSILDINNVPYGILPGNHDMIDNGGVPEYENHFPASRYEGRSYWGGSYDNRNKNNFQLFSAGGMDFVALSLESCPPDNVLAWAGNILDNYRNRRAIISTHVYLTKNGEWDDSLYEYREGNNSGTSIWEKLVKPHVNVFLVLCGHHYGEAIKIDTVNNRTVYQLLSDYQITKYPDRPNDNGWLRIMEFVPSEDNIYVRTYSPYLDNYETDDDSQFVLTYPMGAPENILPNADAFVASHNPSANYGSWTNLAAGVRVDPSGVYRTFLKFDLSGLAGLQILSARLKLYAFGVYGGSYVIEAWSVTDDSWSEGTITWNNKPAPATKLDARTMSSPGWYEWDVKAFVENEAGGVASFALKKDNETTTGISDCIYTEYCSKEYNVAYRPYLEITLPPWTGSATFTFEYLGINDTIYKLNLYKDNLWVYGGRKLVVRFYKYDNSTPDGENVIHEDFSLPWHVVPENENVYRPPGLPCGIKIARFVMTDDAGNVLGPEIASFVMRKTDLFKRYLRIKVLYTTATPEEKSRLAAEYLCIKEQYPSAPS